MKLNRHQLGEVLLVATLNQFQNVPPEDEIDHAFSQGFQTEIKSMTRKSESTAWRVWQAPAKRVVLISVLLMIILLTAACATPAIRSAIIDFFFLEDKTAYGITFDPSQVADAPRVIENIYIPTIDPEGYELVLEVVDDIGVEYAWANSRDEYIIYHQRIIQQGSEMDPSVTIDAENIKRRAKNINGYLVDIIFNKENRQYVALWTDNRYMFMVDISTFGNDQEAILREIMASITEVKTID